MSKILDNKSVDIEMSPEEERIEKTSVKNDESQTKEEERPLKRHPKMDPLKDAKRLKFLKRVISNLCLLCLFLAVKNIFTGICAHLFYDNKQHLEIFGALCVLQAIGAPIGFYAIRFKNNVLFLIGVVVNCVWICSAVALLLYYWLSAHSPQFDSEIELHVSAIFYLVVAGLLAVGCFLVICSQRRARQ